MVSTGHAAFKDDIIEVTVRRLLQLTFETRTDGVLTSLGVGREEADGVLEVGAEGGIAEGGWLPWVASSEKVGENDAEGPDTIEQGEYEPLWANCLLWHSGTVGLPQKIRDA